MKVKENKNKEEEEEEEEEKQSKKGSIKGQEGLVKLTHGPAESILSLPPCHS